MFWVGLALMQFLVWDLISLLVRFQSKHRLEELDAKKDEHYQNEKKLLKVYKILAAINIGYHLTRIVFPLVFAKSSNGELAKQVWLFFVEADAFICIVVIMASIVSVIRVSKTTMKHYCYMWNRYKVSWLLMSLCFIVSFLALVYPNFKYYHELDIL